MPYSNCETCQDSKGHKTCLVNGWNSLFCCGPPPYGQTDNYPHQGLIDWDDPEYNEFTVDPDDWQNLYMCIGCRMNAYYDDLKSWSEVDEVEHEMMEESVPTFEKKYDKVKREITKLRRQQSAVEQFFKQVVSKELEEERWNPNRTLGKLQFDMRLRDAGITYEEDIDEIIDGELILLRGGGNNSRLVFG